MTFDDTMQELAEAGTEQTRKTYRRHGVPEPMFGVSYAKLGELTKRLKRNQPLAEQLWASGNTDARTLATMIAEPKRITRECLAHWADTCGAKSVAAAVANVAAASPHGEDLCKVWIAADPSLLQCAGWATLTNRIMAKDGMTEDEAAAYLPLIEQRLQASSNWVKLGMLNALLAIGIRSDALAALAIASADRIGPVEIDHGDTCCKTPVAAPYIRKARARQHARAAAGKV